MLREETIAVWQGVEHLIFGERGGRGGGVGWFDTSTNIFLILSWAAKFFSREVYMRDILFSIEHSFARLTERCVNFFSAVVVCKNFLVQVCLQEIFSKSPTLPQKSNGSPLRDAYSDKARDDDWWPNQTFALWLAYPTFPAWWLAG